MRARSSRRARLRFAGLLTLLLALFTAVSVSPAMSENREAAGETPALPGINRVAFALPASSLRWALRSRAHQKRAIQAGRKRSVCKVALHRG